MSTSRFFEQPAGEKPAAAAAVDDDEKDDGQDETPAGKEKEAAAPKDEDDATFLIDLDEFDASIKKSVAEALSEMDGKKGKAAAEDEDADETPQEKEIKRLNAELETRKAADAAREQQQYAEKVAKEMFSCAGKYKMTKAEVEQVCDYFEQSPDLMNVVPFETAALRVNPDLKGRLNAPPDTPKEEKGAAPRGQVINRGAAPAATEGERPKFKPNRGDYSDVTRHVLKTGAAARFFASTRG